MSSKTKIIGIVAVLVGLLAIETGREAAVFLSWSRDYEKSYWAIDGRRYQDNVTKSELVEIAGQPTSQSKSNGIESWDWQASAHVGPLLRVLHLPLTRKPYHLSVEFNEEGFVKDVYANLD